MKTVHKIFCMLSAIALFMFAGCDSDSKSWEPKAGEIQVTQAAGESYYSLTTGEKVTNGKSTDWDIGFWRQGTFGRVIMTNSGDTATTLGSNGNGGVWHTEKTDFDSVVLGDRVMKGYEKYNKDSRMDYVYSMSTIKQLPLNVMNYPGYSEGSGTQDNPFKTYKYDQKQFYKGSPYPTTNVVYIVLHGDGRTYSKVQVKDYQYDGTGPSDTYVIRYETLR